MLYEVITLQWLDDARLQVVEGDGAHARWFDPGGGTTTDQRIGYCPLPSPLPGRNHSLCGGGMRAELPQDARYP